MKPIALLLSLVALAGCRTAHFSTSTPAGKNLTGQMHYISAKRSFVGDFTAKVSPADFQLDVSKGPGVALLSVHESNGTLARFEAGKHHWQGHPQHFVPSQLRSWFALHDVFQNRAHAGVRVTRSAQQLTAEFPQTGERFVFIFSGWSS